MRRWVVGVVGLLMLVPSARAQTPTYVYNPTAVEFDHPDEDFGMSDSYVFEVWNEAMSEKLYEFTIPKSSVQTTTGTIRRVQTNLFPPAPIGTTYRIRVIAHAPDCDGALAGDQPCTSTPSNFAPEFVRYSACFNPTTRRNEPVVVTMVNLSVQVGKLLSLAQGQLTITGPSKVTSFTIEALGDGYPALYYTVEDARSGPLPVIGPFRRAGTFSLMVKATDDRGCEGFHSTPYPRLTVTP